MRKRNPEQRARHAKDCSPINGAERRTGTRIACVGVSALIAGQLFMPAASLAAESADQDAATNDAAAPAAQATPAAETAPAASAAPAPAAPAASAPVADSAPAGQQAASQQAQPAAPAATANDAADNVAAPANAAAGQNDFDGNAAALPADAMQARGVTDVTEGGGIKVNTTVVDHYTDCVLPSNVTLVKGQSYTFDFPDVEGGIPEEPRSVITEVSTTGPMPPRAALSKCRMHPWLTCRLASNPLAIT